MKFTWEDHRLLKSERKVVNVALRAFVSEKSGQQIVDASVPQADGQAIQLARKNACQFTSFQSEACQGCASEPYLGEE